MKDQLAWDCYEGCDCVEQGHIHHSDYIRKNKQIC